MTDWGVRCPVCGGVWPEGRWYSAPAPLAAATMWQCLHCGGLLAPHGFPPGDDPKERAGGGAG